MQLNMGALYARIAASSEHDFGLLPLMEGCCDGQIGALNSESRAERVNSAAKLKVYAGNLNLSDDDIEPLTVFRMNRDLRYLCGKNYVSEIRATAVKQNCD